MRPAHHTLLPAMPHGNTVTKLTGNDIAVREVKHKSQQQKNKDIKPLQPEHGKICCDRSAYLDSIHSHAHVISSGPVRAKPEKSPSGIHFSRAATPIAAHFALSFRAADSRLLKACRQSH